ncbi:MAG: type IX secretion system protein PorQ [Muribaculaceae bacterium]|nr:type IX secretion system protein PorQ [Muribaculaceae bacterium]
MLQLRFTYLLIAAFIFISAGAQTGRSAYDFLNVPTSSHVFGLGGTNITIIDDDVTLAEGNPALLGPEVEKQVAVSYMHYLGSANFAGVRYGQAAGEHGAWGAGIRYLNYGEIQGYEQDGTPTGSFTPSDYVFEGTYSHDFTYRLRGGINIKMVYSSYEQYTAFAMAADLGLNYYDDEHDMSLSVVLKNMGGQIKRFDRAYDRLPFDIQLGWMKGLGNSPFSLSVTAFNLTRWHLQYYDHSDDDGIKKKELKESFGKNFFRHFIFGVQYQPTDKVYVDLAYNYKTRSDMSTYQRNFLSGFSVGLGIKTRTFSVGASYAMPHKSASTLLINLGLQISELY